MNCIPIGIPAFDVHNGKLIAGTPAAFATGV
jgi:hypothetical protein